MKPALPAKGRRPGEIRLIGGQWKRSKLPVPALEGLRPTPDRVRETLFNWLGQDLAGWRCLDAFAGTGALGLEAASRGAAQVLLVERDAALARALRASIERLRGSAVATVHQGDGLQALARATAAPVELIFLDPPYDAGLLPRALPLAAAALVPGGWLYVESAEPVMALPAELRPHRQLRAGQVHAALLQRVA